MAKGTQRALILPLAIMVLIGVLSSIPGVDDDGLTFLGLVPPTVQNLLHIPLFASLAWSWHRALLRVGLAGAAACAIAAGISLGWAALDEWHQLYVPGRYATLTDLLLDAAGIAIGLVAAATLAPRSETT